MKNKFQLGLNTNTDIVYPLSGMKIIEKNSYQNI